MHRFAALFSLTWLLAMLWLLLIARLLRSLVQNDRPLYDQLGRPVMRGPGWTIPAARPGPGGFVSLSGLSEGKLELRSFYGLDELVAAVRLWRWIVVSKPRTSHAPEVSRLQRQLRLCGSGFLLGLVALLWMAMRGLQP